MFQILQNMSVWSMKSQVYLLWGDNMVLERGFDQVDLWFLSSDVCRCERRGPSVSKSWAGREGRKSRQNITERRGGSLERAFIFCHILVPADCLGVTGGWSQCSRSQRPPPHPPPPTHSHTHPHTPPLLSSVLSITPLLSEEGLDRGQDSFASRNFRSSCINE